MITFRFYLDGDLRYTRQCPAGSPIPRPGETVTLTDDDLTYTVLSVAYEFTSEGSPAEVIIGIDHF